MSARPPGMRPKPAGRHADGILLHRDSNGPDPRWELTDAFNMPAWPSTEQARATVCPLPQVQLFRPRFGYNRDQPGIMDVLSAPSRIGGNAAPPRTTGQDGGFTSTSTPANSWW